MKKVFRKLAAVSMVFCLLFSTTVYGQTKGGTGWYKAKTNKTMWAGDVYINIELGVNCNYAYAIMRADEECDMSIEIDVKDWFDVIHHMEAAGDYTRYIETSCYNTSMDQMISMEGSARADGPETGTWYTFSHDFRQDFFTDN